MSKVTLSEQDIIGLTLIIGFCTFLLIFKASSAFREKFDTSSDVSAPSNVNGPQVPPKIESKSSETAKAKQAGEEHDPAKTVLVVDDDPVTRRQLRRHIEKLNFQVVEVSDGPSAVEMYQQGKRFCLVLMDYEMPDMDGLLATRKIRSFDNEVIIVGSTIHDPATKQGEFLKAGANLVDIKPISAARLQELMSEYSLMT